MSVARFFSSLFASGSVSISDADSWRLFSGPRGLRSDAGIFVSERLALNLTAVQACVGIIADTMSMIPASVERQNKSGTQWTPVDNDPREHLLNVRPNAYMTPAVARRTTQTVALLWGNGLSEVVRNGKGQGVEMWPLPAGGVLPVLDAETETIRYRGSVGGRQFDSAPEDVVHIRGLTLDGIVGLSPIGESRQAVGLAVALEKYGNKFFANDTRSGGYVTHPETLSEPARKNLQESLNAEGGLERAHTVKLLEEGMTFTANTIPPEDAQFLGTREFTVAEFARMYRVPLELLAAQGKTSSWGSGIEQLFLAFTQWTLRPWIVQWEQELSLKLLTERELAEGLRIRFQVKELLRGDSGARSAFYERMHRIGAMNVNEIRAEEGRNPIEGGDEFASEQPQSGGFPTDSTVPDPREQEADRERKQESM